MDNVFKNFDKDIKSVGDSAFLRYLGDEVMNPVASAILGEIMAHTNVYVFSGVIRDYFLQRRQNLRDIDLVIENEVDWMAIFRKYRHDIKVKINSYGGLKVRIEDLCADVWTMQRTWGLMHKGVAATPQNLIRTAFFNFSAIVYSLNRRRFYIHKAFAQFIENREIGVLYKENPNVPLCIVNSMYYYKELGMSLSLELCRWIVTHYSMFDDYAAPQLAHWGCVRFSREDILLFVSQCRLRGWV
ncbi:MAG: hypothetical protein J6J37_07150 [Bacteroidaceae bacterium]|nr:hypothetical protein [Bacteroidaceae bacterium]